MKVDYRELYYNCTDQQANTFVNSYGYEIETLVYFLVDNLDNNVYSLDINNIKGMTTKATISVSDDGEIKIIFEQEK